MSRDQANERRPILSELPERHRHSCTSKVKLPESARGRSHKCPHCGLLFTVNAKPSAVHEPADLDVPDDAPVRRRTPSTLTTFVRVVSVGAWCLLLGAVAVVGLLFFADLSHNPGASQQAAIGATYSTILIGLYIAVRCAEKIAGVIERATA